MIKDDISRYLVAPWCRFPCQKHSFLKYPTPKIPDDFENKSGTDRVLKKTLGSGRVSGTRWALLFSSVQKFWRFECLWQKNWVGEKRKWRRWRPVLWDGFIGSFPQAVAGKRTSFKATLVWNCQMSQWLLTDRCSVLSYYIALTKPVELTLPNSRGRKNLFREDADDPSFFTSSVFSHIVEFILEFILFLT